MEDTVPRYPAQLFSWLTPLNLPSNAFGFSVRRPRRHKRPTLWLPCVITVKEKHLAHDKEAFGSGAKDIQGGLGSLPAIDIRIDQTH